MTLEQAFARAGLVWITAGLACSGPLVGETGGGSEEGESSSGAAPTSTGADTTSTSSEASTGEPGDTSTGGPVEPPEYEKWLKVELPGTVCGNGSQYKFFVNYKEGAKDLLVMLEPGGACWDFDGCSGNTDLGAAHPDGIPDDLMKPGSQNAGISPLIRREVPGPTADFNMVFLPYCTGDVHTGNNVIVYQDPKGQAPDLEFHHNGHGNVMAATEWMNEQFTDVDRLLVTGCSAGGAGAIINYHFFRAGITSAQRGYLLDDSGPIFPSTGWSAPLHTKIRESWDVDSVLVHLPPGYEIGDDFGVLNTHLADLYPEDRLSTAYFQRDYNYSRYSYENFYEANAKADVLDYWADDTKKLIDLYATRDNLGYYLPYWREFNDSHCATIVTYADTEIEELGLDMGKYIEELLDDDAPLGRYKESVQPGEDD
jgi:hypothetical protein